MNLSEQAAVLDFGKGEKRLKDFVRDNLWFSLCGAELRAMPYEAGRTLSGLWSGEGNQSCKISKVRYPAR